MLGLARIFHQRDRIPTYQSMPPRKHGITTPNKTPLRHHTTSKQLHQPWEPREPDNPIPLTQPQHVSVPLTQQQHS